MKRYSFAHLASQRVLREYDAVETQENADTAMALALLGEIDARRLFVPAGYPSMYAYCLEARHMSEDRAYKRIRVARKAREFPAIYDAISEGRVHLTGLFLLAPLMTAKTVDGLLAAATHKTKAQIELLIAELAPKQDLPARVQPLATAAGESVADAGTEQSSVRTAAAGELAPAPGRVGTIDSLNISIPMVPPAEPRPKLTPLSPQSFGVQFTMDQATHDLLREVQELLGPSVSSADIAKVFALALESLKAKLEKAKFGSCEHTRARRGSKDQRYVPDEIKRAVWKRDGGRCTFVGTGGKRCEARHGLEFDHVVPVARGGETTVANVRLLCEAHNQFEAERVLGTDFMHGKRAQAQERALARVKPGPPTGSLSPADADSRELG